MLLSVYSVGKQRLKRLKCYSDDCLFQFITMILSIEERNFLKYVFGEGNRYTDLVLEFFEKKIHKHLYLVAMHYIVLWRNRSRKFLETSLEERAISRNCSRPPPPRVTRSKSSRLLSLGCSSKLQCIVITHAHCSKFLHKNIS